MEVMKVHFVSSNTKLTVLNNSDFSGKPETCGWKLLMLDFLFFVIVSFLNVSATQFATSSATVLETKLEVLILYRVENKNTSNCNTI